MKASGRRPVMRWGLRLFRQDWRQQVLVIALLSFAIAAALFGAATLSNALPSHESDFGRANGMIRRQSNNPARTAGDLALYRQKFGTLEVIGHRAVPIPGSTATVDFRDQKPGGVFGAPMLGLRAGRYPSASGEIALTRTAAADFHTRLGATVVFGGRAFAVVGLVENPQKLDDDFAVGTTADVAAQDVVVLVHGNFPHHRGLALEATPAYTIEIRGTSDKSLGAALVLLLSSILLTLVVLVATASFAVVAHRRQRQLGMLASVGATDAQLRLVMLSNGVAVGVVAALGGAAVALALWVGLHGLLERLVDHRMGLLDFAWWIPAVTTGLAIASATAAAWWPARAMARVPVVEALSGRPPLPATVHRSIVAAVVLVAAGCAAVDAGVNTKKGNANAALLIPGVLAIVVGVLVLSPIAIRALARLGRRAPLSIRLALRDLNRYSARSGAALAAISLGIGIAVGVVVIAGAAKKHADQGNLSDRQLVFRPQGPPGTNFSTFRQPVDAFAATLGPDARVYELDVAANPHVMNPKDAGDGSPPPPLDLAREINVHSFNFVAHLRKATPELVARLGVVPLPNTDVLTVATGKLTVVPGLERNPQLNIQHYDGPAYSDAPTALLTDAGAAKLGGTVTALEGWMVETGHHLSAAQVRAARSVAANNFMEVEGRDNQTSLLATRTAATAAGVVVALALLAMTIGLIRSEAGRDMQTLTAAGATSYTRRAVTASTSGGLALLGSLLGISGAYLALVSGYLDRISDLSHPPLPELAILLLGLPVIATAAGWLLSGREPVVIVRHALD